MIRIGRIGTLALAGGIVAALLVAERRRPLRRQTVRQGPRLFHNVTMGLACGAVIETIEKPLTDRIAERNGFAGRGLAGRVPRGLRSIVTVLAMDYTFYVWHVATHRVPLLWRFHRVHHVDRDLGASTAIRFHFIDMLVSLPWRLLQVRLSGADRRSLALWRHFFNASILFHHANLRLPKGWDRRLSYLLTTPAMHGIHHSRVLAERDSNWSSGFSLWDRLHGTFRDKPAPHLVAIGIAGAGEREAASIPASLAAPFARRVMP